MYSEHGQIILSAGDLAGHLYCRHLTALERATALGGEPPPYFHDPLLEILRERGALHERGYVERLQGEGLRVVRIEGVGVTAAAVEATRAAMKEGAEVIVQGALLSAPWSGRPDILRRIGTPSALGAWSYEVLDAKLARETKGGTVLQLCLYSDLLSDVQGLTPEHMHVVIPWSDYQPLAYRFADYAAFYRSVKASLAGAVAEDEPGRTYPDPVAHCEVCRWRVRCEARRRADDHLCLVAGMGKLQTEELGRHDIGSTAQLASMPVPVAWKPERGAAQTYERLREQARVQVEGRTADAPVHEMLPIVPGFGLCRLPEPSPGDIFFDLEGDPFIGEGGQEYLFGYRYVDDAGHARYVGEWAITRVEEKAAFERFIDFVLERWERHPDLHVYHFAAYEPGALKRLMGRYATREDDLDRMLRAKLLVDLHAVVRHAILASLESYSLKKLEPFFGFERSVPLPEASLALIHVQGALELGDAGLLMDEIKEQVRAYNEDDCASAAALRGWLEERRSEAIAAGARIERPPPSAGEAGEKVSEWLARITPVIEALTEGVPADKDERTPEQHGRWLLANCLDWHRREEKAVWWEYFRLADLSSEELVDERAGLADLTFIGEAGGTAKCPIHRYSFSAQETELRGGESLHNVGGAKLGSVEALSLDDRTVDIKKRQDSAGVHPEAVFAHEHVGTEPLQEAILRLASHVREHGLGGDGPYAAARDLLLRARPRIGDAPIRRSEETPLEAALRVAPLLQGGVLPVQGPPGAGKTHNGGRMICALVAAGKKVGVTANSHPVIRHMLDCVIEAAEEMGVDLRCIQKPKTGEKEDDQPRLKFAKSTADLFAALSGGSCQVAGGTAWLWAVEDAFESVDVLFVDEAAQMSLASVLAVSHAGKTLVMLGDPQQLDQPMQGSHPEGADVSALQHMLGDTQTVGADQGLFLDVTWRLHPAICEFNSELFYEGRLRPREGLEGQIVKSAARLAGAGLRYVPVAHEGNQNSSPEEADVVRDLVTELLAASPRWVNRDGEEKALTLEDVLVITPYNAQVFEIQRRLPGVHVGTVDKFQGQEAPVAIYSLATSSHADAPRGMEFLYSLNRLNVAISRAQCLSVLVACPRIFEAECRTPRQMQLANAFCRFLEKAQRVDPP